MQIAAQVELTAKSPIWWAMKLARGEKMVRSAPRSRMNLSWLVSIDSLSSSSLILRSDGFGMAAGSLIPAIC